MKYRGTPSGIERRGAHSGGNTRVFIRGRENSEKKSQPDVQDAGIVFIPGEKQSREDEEKKEEKYCQLTSPTRFSRSNDSVPT